LTNLVPLRNPENNVRWITVTYEAMLLDPERVLKRIFDEWAMEVPPGALDRVREASATTKEATFQTSVEAQLHKWKSQFTDEQVRRMANVLSYFDVAYYDEGTMPLIPTC